MPIRNTHKVGDYLMQDDESGFVHYRSDMTRIWDGTYRHRDNYESRQPQEFVKALKDPRALKQIRQEPDAQAPINAVDTFVRATPVLTPRGPAAHLFSKYPAIATMVIEGSARVIFKVS